MSVYTVTNRNLKNCNKCCFMFIQVSLGSPGNVTQGVANMAINPAMTTGM